MRCGLWQSALGIGLRAQGLLLLLLLFALLLAFLLALLLTLLLALLLLWESGVFR